MCTQVQGPTKAGDIGFPGAGVAGSCEPPSVDAGDQMQTLSTAEASLSTSEVPWPLCLFTFLFLSI